MSPPTPIYVEVCTICDTHVPSRSDMLWGSLLTTEENLSPLIELLVDVVRFPIDAIGIDQLQSIDPSFTEKKARTLLRIPRC